MTGLSAVDAARAALALGLCVLPPKEDGSKMPIAERDPATKKRGWKQWQSQHPTSAKLEEWYANGRTGLGLVCGAVSGNLELFEFDDHDTYDLFKAAAASLSLADLVERIEGGYLEETPGGGVHWFWHCSPLEGNQKLAQRPTLPEERTHPKDHVRTLIETRYEGGYAVVAPSNGKVHPSGGAYRRLRGGFDTIASISEDERTDLFQLARSFDQMPRREAFDPPPLAPRSALDGDRPGEVFNARADWAADVLEPNGWAPRGRSGDMTYWLRPGGKGKWSATLNYQGNDRLHVFTTSTALEPEKSYTKFSVYAILAYGGDFSAAARAVAERFGLKPPVKPSVRPAEPTTLEQIERRGSDGADLVCKPQLEWEQKNARIAELEHMVLDRDHQIQIQQSIIIAERSEKERFARMVNARAMLDRNPDLSPADKIVIPAAFELAYHRKTQDNTRANRQVVYLDAIRERTGVGNGTISKSLERVPAIGKITHHGSKEEGRLITIAVDQDGPVASLLAVANYQANAPRNHGGKRVRGCRNGCNAPLSVQSTTTVFCTGCGELTDETHSKPRLIDQSGSKTQVDVYSAPTPPPISTGTTMRQDDVYSGETGLAQVDLDQVSADYDRLYQRAARAAIAPPLPPLDEPQWFAARFEEGAPVPPGQHAFETGAPAETAPATAPPARSQPAGLAELRADPLYQQLDYSSKARREAERLAELAAGGRRVSAKNLNDAATSDPGVTRDVLTERPARTLANPSSLSVWPRDQQRSGSTPAAETGGRG